MKKWMIMFMSFLLSACGVSKAEKQYAYKEGDQIPYEVVTAEQLPQHMKALYEKQHKQFQTYTVQQDGVTYVVIHLGERRTGGYGVEVIDVRYEKGKAIVYYKERKPAPDAVVTQAFTYPKVAIKIKTSVPIEIKKK
ncbi:protease complex subunit PrcB family protein [Anoxybacillus ayderensis]|uniref:protease complex subunit PrcB family protein n=1 Tax=Anoxybacillus ayderensis TaxID=265546 RepID=UPI002E1F87AF|nr:protease complex subunit PrcB family protein [Anoxybacillus ayderensis]